MFARIPVPWDVDNPKSQVVDGLNYGRFESETKRVTPLRYFDDLFSVNLEVLLLVKNPPVPVHLRKLILSDEEMPQRLELAVVRGLLRARAPDPIRTQVTMRDTSDVVYPDLSVQEWKELEEIVRASPPAPRRPDVMALPPTTAGWGDLPVPWRRRRDKRFRDLEARRFGASAGPVVMPTSLSISKAEWERMPPSLVKWAVDRGIKRAEAPPPRRSAVYAREQRSEIFLALSRGEWVRVSDLDIFPPRLRKWLEDCEIELIRWFGSGNVGGGAGGLPVNGYVTEDGTVFYCAEDGSTFYVQET